MSGLLSSLTDASAALSVFSRALGVDQANVANASTPGYAVQRATISPIGGNDAAAAGSDFIAISSRSDSFADASVRASSSQASRSGTSAQQLSAVNQLFDITGSSGILAALQNFSSAFSSLSVTPNDSILQTNALNAAGNVASAFQSAAKTLDSQKNQIDSTLGSLTSQINSLAGDIQKLNVATAASTGDPSSTDSRLRSDLDQLSSLIDVTVTKNGDGTVNVLAGGQLPLVEGAQAYALAINPSVAPGSQVTSFRRRSFTGRFLRTSRGAPRHP